MQENLANPTRVDYHWPLLFLAYFSLQILLRIAIGRGLGIDEAELMLTARTLEWGYGAQPPLYSWIQHGLFALFGETIFALALLKNSFLCLTYLALFRLLRSHYDREVAGLATLSLLLLPQIGWESQRALSHSVLATAMASITLLLFYRLIATRSPWFYFLFGVAVALGILSKFNYIILPVAMLIAAISQHSTRGAILNPRILLSLGATTVIILMPIRWIITNQTKVFESIHKFKIQGDAAILKSAVTGFLSLAEASFLFLAVVIVILIFLYYRYADKTIKSSSELPFFQLLIRTTIVALLLTQVVILWSGTTNVKDRWLQPILFLAAPVMTLWLLPKLSKLGRHRFVQAVGVAALLIFIAQPVHDIRPSQRSAPFPVIVSAIADKYPEAKTLFAKDKWIGGNLRYLKNEWTIAIPGSNPEALEGEVVLIWQGKRTTVPDTMSNYLEVQNKEIVSIDPITTIKVAYSPRSEAMVSMSFTAMLIR